MVLLALWFAALTGTWTGVRVNGDGREEPVTLRLQQDGAALRGSIRISAGEVTIRNGGVQGNSVSFTTEIPFLPAPQITEYRGKLNGDRIELEILREGGSVRRTAWVRRTSANPEPWLREWPSSAPPKDALPPNGLALTPPMGWNSWNRFGTKIDDTTVRAIADALVSTGLRDAGYRYVTIDDGWQGQRDASGRLHPNSAFPDMQALAEYLHERGLKLGLYSSPGPKTCAGFEGSFRHEEQDAHSFATWGVDFLKYDWCSAGLVWNVSQMGDAFRIMAAALRTTGRPIVYSISQYGLLRVWEWAAASGANLWRTTTDIGNSWASLRAIGFSQIGLEKFAAPGRWNDPDMLEIGNGVLSLEEERTHFTLWAILAAPLILGHDVRQTKPETLALLKNSEVIALNQDPLGRQAYRAVQRGGEEIWLKPLSGGAWAIALFNLGEQPASPSVLWTQLGIPGTPRVRDLWKGEDWGKVQGGFSHRVEAHSCALFKVTP